MHQWCLQLTAVWKHLRRQETRVRFVSSGPWCLAVLLDILLRQHFPVSNASMIKPLLHITSFCLFHFLCTLNTFPIPRPGSWLLSRFLIRPSGGFTTIFYSGLRRFILFHQVPNISKRNLAQSWLLPSRNGYIFSNHMTWPQEPMICILAFLMPRVWCIAARTAPEATGLIKVLHNRASTISQTQ